ncbi:MULTISPECIES: flap endonuclease Xni [Tatumella]|uniref:Flap endonuclease Xni n=1 Tax=Tatumella punctata TaxID=399969 RepID=A0ABW1VRU0_9GAMM|nr:MULTISPECIES: flap endonuclease Xni [unclassified Tatumella]MBS0855896.1 flap endonuclease Xni [Tatumella sp. JGM16]MBS0876980.1 flap endonuclease Xni [Tatumella sp. JGM82]MBS0890883.1 flap endonuclease Xni [Tatumella sp. JGM94]MBS0893568.1 flap endonuclease Xni [Tatumella sp. JGM130]MBS0901872.1 flap endonuclease Xni [Tatumella sp. JGM100]
MTLHLLIIDALNLIRRIHAVQAGSCAAGTRSALRQLLQHSQPTHVVAVFDNPHQRRGWRHQQLSGYKAGRPDMPDDLKQLMPSLQQLFEASGIHCWQAGEDEADDLAATLASKMSQAGHQTTIVSTDKGYCQLLAPDIRLRDYFQKRWLDVPFIRETYGVSPQQLPDYWGLCGISSSKIPGVSGIGPKSASELINRFNTLEQLYQQLDQVPEKWQKKLQGTEQIALLSRRVARLSTGLNLQGNLKSLRYLPAGSDADQ